MSDIYPLEERVKARRAYSQLQDLAMRLQKAGAKNEPLPEATLKGIELLTKTQDPSLQFRTLLAMAEDVRSKHLAKLLPLARDEFNAFCEYTSPDEPPESPWHIYMTQLLEDIEKNPERNRFILNCPPGHAKPLHVDTPVLMADHGWKRLASVQVGDQVITHTGLPRKVTAVHEQGELDLVRITTEKGREILAAPDHPFLVSGEWINAGDLRPQMPLTMIGAGHTTPTEPLIPDDHYARFCAYVLAVGGFTQATSPYTGDDYTNYQLWFSRSEHADDAEEVLRACGIRYNRMWAKANRRWLFRLRGSDVKKSASTYGFGSRAPDRRIPDWIYKLSDRSVCAFLTAFLSVRGRTLKTSTLATLKVPLHSVGLARDIQRLLARLHVDSTLQLPAGDSRARPALKIVGPALETLLSSGIKLPGCYTGEFLRKRATYGSRLADRVLSVVPAGRGQCRCLTVETDSTFIVENAVVHNSTYASRKFVAWRLGRNPWMKIIGGGHSQRFVENEFSKKIRSLVSSPEFRAVFPEVRIDHSTRAADQWAIAADGGQYVAKGVGQAVHGFRAHFICVDDPYPSLEAAESPNYREKVNTWFVSDIGSRILPGGKTFLIMTRFHEEDLTGYLMAMNEHLPPHDRWELVEAPALCIDPDTDVMGRQLGEVLWDYYDLSYYVTKKAEWTFQRFALIYQQMADAMSDDSVASKFQYYQVPLHRTAGALRKAKEAEQVDELGRPQPNRREYYRRVILSVDCAAKVTQRADYTVVQTWGEAQDGSYHLLRQRRKKVEFDDMIVLIEKQASEDQVDLILVEDKGQGTAYIQNRGRTDSHRLLAPAPVIGIDPKGQSKEFRFDEVSPLISAGEVHLPQKAPWLDGFLKEVGQFPEGAHDDQVDCMTQALKYLRGSKRRGGTKKIGSFG